MAETNRAEKRERRMTRKESCNSLSQQLFLGCLTRKTRHSLDALLYNFTLIAVEPWSFQVSPCPRFSPTFCPSVPSPPLVPLALRTFPYFYKLFALSTLSLSLSLSTPFTSFSLSFLTRFHFLSVSFSFPRFSWSLFLLSLPSPYPSARERSLFIR